MIRLEFDYETKTIMGHSRCQSTPYVYDDYRDIKNVEETVAILRKFFTNKNLNSQCVTFSYSMKDYSSHNVSRYWHNYGSSYSFAVWDGARSGAHGDLDDYKFTAKDFREMYLECADLAIEYEREVEREERRKEAV